MLALSVQRKFRAKSSKRTPSCRWLLDGETIAFSAPKPQRNGLTGPTWFFQSREGQSSDLLDKRPCFGRQNVQAIAVVPSPARESSYLEGYLNIRYKWNVNKSL